MLFRETGEQIMKKEFIVRDIDIEYLNHLENSSDEFQLDDYLTNEYGSHGFTICSSTPIFKNGELIAYKFIFVKDSDEEEND